MTRALLLLFVLALLVPPVEAQQASLDWKLHDAGSVLQVVNNHGGLSGGQTNYPRLINGEFPLNSFEEHVGQGGIWIGSINPAGDTLVSVAQSWSSSVEFYPTDEPWDTVWVAERGDTLDIPYWDGPYAPMADQDFVMRYNDYGPVSRRQQSHEPLYLDVVQTSHAWASPPMDEVIIYTYRVLPQRDSLRQAYVAVWLDGNVGYRTESGWAFAGDDYSQFYDAHKLAVAVDDPGGPDGRATSPIGLRVYPPDEVDAEALDWTFNPYLGVGSHTSPPSLDGDRYREMASGVVQKNQLTPYGSQFMVAFGPLDVPPGDTVTFHVAEVMGESEVGDPLAGVMENVEMLDLLVERDFQVPAPPPSPSLRVTMQDRRVLLDWQPQPGDVNPETYEDPNRADGAEQPFEGYRVYKSTNSASGPWTLLAKFDVRGNAFESDAGLAYEFVDDGLVNNVEYFYTVTAFSKPDTAFGAGWPSQESSLGAAAREVVPGTPPPAEVGEVAVVPNPYRGDVRYQDFDPPWEKPPPSRERWLEQDRRVQFINLPPRCRIQIYTVSGTLVNTLLHESGTRGYEDWNLTSSVGQAVAGGLYLFTVENLETREVQTGKFVIIK